MASQRSLRIAFIGHFAIFRALLLSIEPGSVVRATLALSALCARGVMAVSLGSGIATVAFLVARRPHGQQLSIAMVPLSGDVTLDSRESLGASVALATLAARQTVISFAPAFRTYR